MKSKNKKSSNKRSIVSLGLFVLFILLPVSGKMMSISKYDANAMHLWGDIHRFVGFLFTIFGIFHIVYNWKPLKKYLIRK